VDFNLGLLERKDMELFFKIITLCCFVFCATANAVQTVDRSLLELKGGVECGVKKCKEEVTLASKKYDGVIQEVAPGRILIELKDTYFNLMERDIRSIRISSPGEVDEVQSHKLSRLMEEYNLLSAPYQSIDIKSSGNVEKSIAVFRVPTWSTLPLQSRLRGTLLKLDPNSSDKTNFVNASESYTIKIVSKPHFLFVDEVLENRAIQILKEFLNGDRDASSTFLINETGKLLALVDLLRIPNVISTSNLFFLFWPSVDKLEIGLEPRIVRSRVHQETISNVAISSIYTPGAVIDDNLFTSRLLSDSLITRSYKDYLVNLGHVDFENNEAAIESQNSRDDSRLDKVERFANLHSFIRKSNSREHDLEIGPGKIEIKNSLKLPYGFSLLIQPNTTLIFSQDTGLIVQGKLDILGSADDPVMLIPIEDSWRGVAVIESNELSTWRYVTVKDTRGLQYPFFTLDGGVSFILSDFKCSYCVFSGSSASDVLNILSSNFSVSNSKFSDAASDLIDLDFSRGVLRDVSFKDTEGDAIDVGGGELIASGVHIASAGDKGISAGERAIVKISDSRIENVAFGAASKDGASIALLNVDIERVTIGLLSYRQSASLGYGVLHAVNVNIASRLLDTARQENSTLLFNGLNSEKVLLNVSGFYLISKLQPTYYRVLAVLAGFAIVCFYLLYRLLVRLKNISWSAPSLVKKV